MRDEGVKEWTGIKVKGQLKEGILSPSYLLTLHLCLQHLLLLLSHVLLEFKCLLKKENKLNTN